MAGTKSFRDPAGHVQRVGDRIFRVIRKPEWKRIEPFWQTDAAADFVGVNILSPDTVGSIEGLDLPDAPDDYIIAEHDAVWFPSYPYEWAPEMLHHAGELTLRIALTALDHQFGLKDATPYNTLFQGPEAVFVDALSVEQRDPGDYTWLPYAQYIRCFLLPLLANRYFGLPLADIFYTRRDGLEPQEVFRLCSFGQKVRPPFLDLVSLPTWLSNGKSGNQAIYQKREAGDQEKAKYILGSQLRNLQKKTRQLAPQKGVSVWSDYEDSHDYSQAEMAVKAAFLESVLAEHQPGYVLDIGCNTGVFSLMAAKTGARVVAIDLDPVVVGALWKKAKQSQADILPLVVNIARPSPAVGWCNSECQSFLERARDRFDLVLMLAVLHHLLVTERIPLEQIFDLAWGLTSKYLVIEYVDPADAMFKLLTRGREALFADYNQSGFESACQSRFEIVARQPVGGRDRTLYLLRKRV
ncbi:MAG: class I SAM-dependent methyltransferase [Solirubrobacterales bacterium]